MADLDLDQEIKEMTRKIAESREGPRLDLDEMLRTGKLMVIIERGEPVVVSIVYEGKTIETALNRDSPKLTPEFVLMLMGMAGYYVGVTKGYEEWREAVLRDQWFPPEHTTRNHYEVMKGTAEEHERFFGSDTWMRLCNEALHRAIVAGRIRPDEIKGATDDDEG